MEKINSFISFIIMWNLESLILIRKDGMDGYVFINVSLVAFACA